MCLNVLSLLRVGSSITTSLKRTSTGCLQGHHHLSRSTQKSLLPRCCQRMLRKSQMLMQRSFVTRLIKNCGN
ncbi:hypothetical protein FR483_n217L [Paramecium bursaria Chlorella virus FR483]|uniref:Uncharacterized protein n217L n=1 Tax=Paramecium bursaria Chlorella virus FR483 TaxID=399781 RepID=A7J6S1_PBCVF|nr:hypothetical protein FR483_n217L [Paramecium bursaria Chlorella virus FR483]ABT15502.1 hypothetical protein FR483_n217L [Paramecium bursaria Chlorella virus FR483]